MGRMFNSVRMMKLRLLLSKEVSSWPVPILDMIHRSLRIIRRGEFAEFLFLLLVGAIAITVFPLELSLLVRVHDGQNIDV